MSYYRAVAKRSELVEGDAHIVSVDGREIALFQIDGEVHALENVCPHRGGPIGEGLVKDGHVTCPWHEWTFEIRSGTCTLNAAAFVQRFPVRIDGEDVLVLPEPEPRD
ncbi:MAG: Rieske 2Fe-2S domain-containing protein [Acidobacteriota bacterium]|jgi:nitrite reductase (NADH) small subunit